jgi:formylglycine-generating enzyme required for sulfatase activity
VEWEYACRGSATSRTKFWWGSDEETGRGRINGAGAEYSAKFPETQKYNFVWNDNHLYTSPVGAFGVKGRNAFGLSDMLGNVWECATLGPADKHEFTWRGGSFAEGSTIIRCASTRHRYTDKPAANAGFRVVLSK